MLHQQQIDLSADIHLLDTPENIDILTPVYVTISCIKFNKHKNKLKCILLSLKFYNPLIKKYFQNLWLTSSVTHH